MKNMLFAGLLLGCVCVSTARAVPVPGVIVDGGVLNVEYFAGSGANTSYLVADFAGGGSGPLETYAFAYQWDGATTTADALLAIDAAGGLLAETTDFGGGLGLFIDRLAYNGDDDTPDFNIDSRFWNFFEGELTGGTVVWTSSSGGISQRSLLDGSFDGFIAKTFEDPTEPRVPTYDPADTDLDGDVDTADLTTMFQNFTGDVGGAGGKTMMLGDSDIDGDVDTADLTTGFQNFTGSASAGLAAVPEPGSLVLLLMGLAGLTVARRRRVR